MTELPPKKSLLLDGSETPVWGLGFRVQGSGFRVWSVGF